MCCVGPWLHLPGWLLGGFGQENCTGIVGSYETGRLVWRVGREGMRWAKPWART